MAKLIHTMIRVLDLEKSLAFYRDVLDMTPSHTLDFPDFTLVYLRNEEDDAEHFHRATFARLLCAALQRMDGLLDECLAKK